MPHKFKGERTLMRIFIGESDKYQGRPLYQALLERLRAKGLAGATVLRGVIGFGAHSRLHTYKILRLSEDLPIVIEIVDAQDKIDAFLPRIDEIVQEGMITMESVRVIKYRAGNPRRPPAAGQAGS